MRSQRLHWLLLSLVCIGPFLALSCRPQMTQQAAPTALPPTAAGPTALPTPAGPPPTPTLGPGMFVNPVLNIDFPDPDLLKVGDTYYAYATGAGPTNIQMARSKDLVKWDVLS